ncbi:MAG: T9SS type A sorting domain-containing protein [bacterium]|nr:T9SS type A sorting domain-containing protein [bacterium]
MKNILKFLLALGVCTSAFAQIKEVTRLPVQDISQSIKESAPVWISEDEIIIFYVNPEMDTIFSSKSTDRGISWQDPKVVQEINLLTIQDAIYLTALKTISGRILFAWSVMNESMKLIYSDNLGESWSEPLSIMGGGSQPVFQKSSRFLNITQWENGEICLCFWNHWDSRSFYKMSLDDGTSWSVNAFWFPPTAVYGTRELSIISVGPNSLVAVYERIVQNFSGIYSRISSDYGLNWSDPIVIADQVYHEGRPKVLELANGNIIVVYQRDNITAATSSGDKDIYYKISSDRGVTWSEEIQFTRYIGEDNSHSISTFNNKSFISFATERYSEIIPTEFHHNIAYGILQESEEKFTPPKVYHAYAQEEFRDYENESFVLKLTVIDDEAVKSVTVVIDDSVYIGQAFDDGLHDDGEANDSVFANTFPLFNHRYINGYNFSANKIELPMNHSGLLADVSMEYNLEVRVLSSDYENNQSTYKSDISLVGIGSLGKFEEGEFLFSGGFYLSGYTNGTMWSNGVASSSLVEDYIPGMVGSDPEDPLSGIYVVRKDDLPFGSSWQDWKNAVSLGAEFYDGDGDGIYNPVDKNWNGTWDLNEDMPPLIGDVIAWCVFNDGRPAYQRRWQSEPQGIEIRQTLFAINDPELENVIFIKYKILNTGSAAEIMDSVYFGVWEDADVGDANDDIVGCDTLLQSGFYYSDVPDWVYGDNPPSFFTSLLQGPIIKTGNTFDTAYNFQGTLIGVEEIVGALNLNITSHTLTIGGDPDLNDPNDANEARNYLEGRTRTGFYPDPCTFLYFEVKGGVDCSEINPRFWVSGDPVTDIGWLSSQNRDCRNIVSTGPFQLEKDKPQEIIIAYVIGRGSDPLNSVTVARENVQRAIQEYESNFASITYTPPPATNPVNSYVLYQNYPNPFNPTTTIRYELPQDGVVTIEVFDILGQKVKTILNEFKRADRYEVTFSSTGLASGVYIYQLRVNDFITSKKMILLR